MAIQRQASNLPTRLNGGSSNAVLRALKSLPARLIRIALRQLDTAYFLAQAVVNGLGLRTLTREVPPEKVTPQGQRLAVLAEAPGRWPQMEIPLPLGALFHMTAESMLQRSALWVAPGTIGEVEDFLRAELGRYAADARDVWSGTTHILHITPLTPHSTGTDIVSSVNLLVNQHGLVMMGVRQERSPSRRTRRLMRKATAWPLDPVQDGSTALGSGDGETECDPADPGHRWT